MAKVSALIVLLATILAGFSGRAFAEDSDGADHQPILTINVSMHTAAVRSVSADRSCALVATASDDKTVKLWRMPGGKLLDTIRLPIGPGNDGKMFAVAMAPQGDWLAAGGWSKTGGIHFVYVVHTATGVVAARLGPFKHVIDHLAISPDGRFLAATFRRGLGLRVWERSSENLNLWRLVRDDRNYSGKDVRAAAFGSNNVIYTVSYEGKLRRYSLDVGQPPLLKATSGGGMPSSIAVSNDGKKLAVGFADSPSVDLYDPDSLTLVRTIKNLDIKAGAFENVAWNRTGDRLFAGGSAGHDRHFKLRVWDKGGDAAPVDSDIADNSILQLASCGEGVAVAASDPAFGLVSGDGKLNQWQGRLAADMRGKLDRAFSISKDGLRVRYGLDFGIGRPVVFSVEDDDLADAPEAEADMFPPTVEGLPVTDWLDSTSPKLDGQELALSVHERSQSLAIAPDAARFVLGTDFYVRAYDAAGNELWKQQTPGVAWGVNISRDGRYAVAACGDGTIRWYELNNGTPLAALFVQAQERRWVVWTPKGYFSASAAGENLIGWHLNNGPGDAADFFPIYKFRDRYYQPDIVKKTLALASEDDAVAAAKTASSASASDQPVVSSFLPVIKIASPKDGATITGNQTSVKYLLRSAAGSGAIQVIGFAGGRQKTVVEFLLRFPRRAKTSRFRSRSPPAKRR